ncbi:MAG: hypothetical protein LC667_03140 [Thioalkalivibrio sp.]|nr:hypothetical protein [Thioalkalivibrio sp.]
MRRLTPTLKKMLDALAMEGLSYSDLPEMLPRSAKDQYLTGPGPHHRAAAAAEASGATDSGAMERPKRLGLFLGPYATRALIDYALESCTRLKAELVVFTFMDDAGARRLLEAHLPAAEGAEPRISIEHLSGDPERALEGLQGRGIRLEFLVCDEQGYLGHRLLAREIALDIPVVMVTPPRQPPGQRLAEIPAGVAPSKG